MRLGAYIPSAGGPSCGSALISPVRGGGGGGWGGGERGRGKWIGKNVKTGILNYPSPGETEIKISHLFFKPTPIVPDAEMKVDGKSIVRFFKICL